MEPSKGGWQVPSAAVNISFRFCLDALHTSLYVLHFSFTSLDGPWLHQLSEDKRIISKYVHCKCILLIIPLLSRHQAC